MLWVKGLGGRDRGGDWGGRCLFGLRGGFWVGHGCKGRVVGGALLTYPTVLR